MRSLTRHPVLYLVRHGAIEAAHARKFVGQVDAHLSAEGIHQAWSLRAGLRNIVFTSVFSSDLDRSRITAEIIAGDRNPEVFVDRDLREISLGEWEGREFDEIAGRFPDAFQSRGRDIEHWRPPGGESFVDCGRRVQRALGSIVEAASGNILVAGHAGVNRVILCQALGLPLANLLRIGQDYGCLNVIDYAAGGLRVKLLNYVPAAVPRGEKSCETSTWITTQPRQSCRPSSKR